jgi:predicted nucleotidyltransferase
MTRDAASKAMTREEAVAKIVPRLVEFYRPERIYLFGSTARGDYREDSDIDFMVLLPDDAPKELFRASHQVDLWGIPYGTDILTRTVSDFDKWLPLRASFSSTIVEEGRLLYEHAAVAH